MLSFLIAALLAWTPAARAAAPEVRPPPLERTVSLNLWGEGLYQAAREIQKQTGVEILFYQPDLPPDASTDDLFLVTGQVSLRTVLECLARRYSFRYRLSDSGKVELAKGYGWVGGRQELRFHRLDALAPAGADRSDETRMLLNEFVKPLALLDGDFALKVEKYPLPGNADALQAVAVLPPPLSSYLERALACLAGESGDYPAGPTRPGANLYAKAAAAALRWEALLDRRVKPPVVGDLRSFLAGVGEQAGVAILAVSPPEGGGALPVAGEPSLGRVTEELTSRLGLGRRVFLASGAVLFEPGSVGDWEMDSRSREYFWTGLAAAGFDAAVAAERLGGGDALADRLRREVFPNVWRDPACAVAFSAVTRRLAVVAPMNVVETVATRLAEIGGR